MGRNSICLVLCQKLSAWHMVDVYQLLSEQFNGKGVREKGTGRQMEERQEERHFSTMIENEKGLKQNAMHLKIEIIASSPLAPSRCY